MSSGSQLWKHFYTIDVDDGQHGILVGSEQELVPGETFFDLPPDSFWVPQGHENDWVDQRAVMQRKTSMKLSFIGNRNQHSNSMSHSQRFSPSLNSRSKASLIGLPRTPKSGVLDGSFRQNKAGSARLFRSLSEPGGKLILDVPEPGSPKISCIGRLERQKGRSKRTGLWSSFKSVLRTGFGARGSADKGNVVSA